MTVRVEWTRAELEAMPRDELWHLKANLLTLFGDWDERFNLEQDWWGSWTLLIEDDWPMSLLAYGPVAPERTR